MKSLGYKAPAQDSIKHQFAFGKNKTFDPNAPAEYIRSFAIAGPKRVEAFIMDRIGVLTNESGRSYLQSSTDTVSRHLANLGEIAVQAQSRRASVRRPWRAAPGR
jgi:hypothetical protein